MMPGEEKAQDKASDSPPAGGTTWIDVAKVAVPVLGTVAAAFFSARYSSGNSTGFKIEGDKNSVTGCMSEGHTTGFDVKGTDNILKDNSASGPGCTVM